MLVKFRLTQLVVSFVLLHSVSSWADSAYDIFVGHYVGSTEFEFDGASYTRDLSVDITTTKKGFNVSWKAVTQKQGGKFKTKSYSINFIPSDRTNVYSSAMRANVFGGQAALDPLKGDPFVWARIDGDTLTVNSLLITDDGGYEMQVYNRTLVENGLALEFERFRNGKKLKTVNSVLIRE